MPNQKNLNYLGYKLFRFPEEEEKAQICRCVRAYNNGQVMIRFHDGVKKKTTIDEMKENGWEVLSAPGLLTASIITIHGSNDVVVTFHKPDILLEKTHLPAVICRQSVTDFFYSFLSGDEHHPHVGVSVSQKTCPVNIPFEQLLVCDEINYSVVAHTYLDDTIEDMLELVNQSKFDDVLRKLFERHIKGKEPLLSIRSIVNGWCSNLKMLLVSNNFLVDVDQEFNISTVDFDVENYLIEKNDVSGKRYFSFDQEATLFFMRNYKINITDNYVILYGYDIDFSDYQNTHYLLVRSCTGKVYMMIYLCDGEYVETDLEIAEQEKQIAASLNLHVYNKYGKNKK